MSDIISYLFNTNAIKFCEENKPFWYTSGKIGPYFINTHFVYGNEEDAKELLSFIDEQLSDKLALPKNVFEKVLTQYNTNQIYKDVIDTMIATIKENIDISEIDYISGGERRDWFFSNIIAYLLDKPHISIYKDLNAVVSSSNFEETKTLEKIEDAKVLHIADLVTGKLTIKKIKKPTEDDLAVLKYAKLCGAKYVAQDGNGDIFMYFQRPHKYPDNEIDKWTNTDNDYLQIYAPISFISWEDDEPVCIECYV